MTVEILICTLDGGINRIKNIILPAKSNLCYLISWQHFKDANIEVPKELLRDDIRIINSDGVGLSRNRNIAINKAIGDICFIADDDVSYNEDAINKIVQIYESDASLDIITFKRDSGTHNLTYPSFSFDLRCPPKFYYTSSIEISFRRTSVQGILSFNELLGLGAPVLKSGEENLFLFNALKHDMKCFYYPISVVSHIEASTSEKAGGTKGVVMARAVLIKAHYPHSYMLRFIITAYRIAKAHKVSYLKTLLYLYKGKSYGVKHKIID